MQSEYIPERGDIVFTDFDPSAGHEQAHQRPALVLSPKAFNQQIKLALVAPITSTVRGHGFEVSLTQPMQTTGVVLCHQVKTIDYKWRGVRFIERATDTVTYDVLARVSAILS
jgi:mRNA interferase MazF